MVDSSVDHSGQVCATYQRAAEIIGRRWSAAILRALLGDATQFCQVRAAVPDVSNRMLSERLREFEAEGIVQRLVIPERPVRVEYRLTEKGRALEGVVEAVAAWAEEWVSIEETGDEQAAESS